MKKIQWIRNHMLMVLFLTIRTLSYAGCLKMNSKIIRYFILIPFLCSFSNVQAGMPLWSFTPLTATTISVPSNGTATIRYSVRNNARIQKSLNMRPIAGITQVTTEGFCGSTFVLGPGQSCELNLSVSGKAMTHNIVNEGPIVCVGSSNLQCYQPASSNLINVTKTTAVFHYAYFTNTNDSTITKCTIDETNGALSACAHTATDYAGLFSNPYGLTINNGFAYIANLSNNNIVQCTVNSSTAELENCSIAADGVGSPSSIAAKNNLAYVENFYDNKISVCSINVSTGAFDSGCSLTGGSFSFNGPQGGIAFYNSYAYFPGYSNNSISICSIESSGQLSGCTSNTSNELNGPNGIAINNNYAYITNANNSSVSVCLIDSSSGSLPAGSCPTTSTTFNSPNGIGFFNNYAYVENSGNSTVSLCSVNTSTGLLINCSSTGSIFNGPQGQIGFY